MGNGSPLVKILRVLIAIQDLLFAYYKYDLLFRPWQAEVFVFFHILKVYDLLLSLLLILLSHQKYIMLAFFFSRRIYLILKKDTAMS